MLNIVLNVQHYSANVLLNLRNELKILLIF